MKDTQTIVNVFSGTEVQVIILKGLLESINVPASVQNDFQSGISAGFGGGTASTIRLNILESDLEKAKPVLKEFISNQ